MRLVLFPNIEIAQLKQTPSDLAFGDWRRMYC